MKEFKTMEDVFNHLFKTSYPNEVERELISSMLLVEECNNGGATSTLIIADDTAEATQVEQQLNLSKLIPEVDEVINTSRGDWHKKVFVVDDAGGGVVLFFPSPPDNENGSK